MTHLNDEMKKLADAAVGAVEGTYHVKLDYEGENIVKLDDIFSYLHKAVPRNIICKVLRPDLTRSHWSFAALILGAYIGEVIRNKHGGEWVLKDKTEEQSEYLLKVSKICLLETTRIYKKVMNGTNNVVALEINATSIFPITEAYKRIMYGAENSILDYYKAVIEIISK